MQNWAKNKSTIGDPFTYIHTPVQRLGFFSPSSFPRNDFHCRKIALLECSTEVTLLNTLSKRKVQSRRDTAKLLRYVDKKQCSHQDSNPNTDYTAVLSTSTTCIAVTKEYEDARSKTTNSTSFTQFQLIY